MELLMGVDINKVWSKSAHKIVIRGENDQA